MKTSERLQFCFATLVVMNTDNREGNEGVVLKIKVTTNTKRETTRLGRLP